VCGAHVVSGDDAPLNLIMNPIDTSQLNNSSRKTWDWSIRYGIDQLNSPIDQSLVLMVTMKQASHLNSNLNTAVSTLPQQPPHLGSSLKLRQRPPDPTFQPFFFLLR
jgi:hypothetical protein